MILSVIIVNYRVKYFLQLCLYSVEKALEGLDAEIIVVDNHSGDGSLEWLGPLFPGVRFLANTENKGFGRANNEAVSQARGKYILFLNPDTVLPEDGVTSCLSFLERTPGVGGLGVRMVDGGGRFLKESRRGFPSPWVAFCKMMGLTALFPHSRFLATYYLGHQPEFLTHPAPVLSGACLWVSRAILDRVGGFDELFFMYAEDIDLSYRIEKAGFVNYYFAGTTIVHFKGESTQKDIRYVKLFYKAMSQFRRKHSHTTGQRVLNGLLEIAIWSRAGLRSLSSRGAPTQGRKGRRQPLSGQPVLPEEGRKEKPGKLDPAANGPVRTWVTGDPLEAEKLIRRKGFDETRSFVETPEEAEEVFFCVGPHFSFKTSIETLEELAAWPGVRIVRFLPSGSEVAVGSADKDRQGDVIILGSDSADIGR